MRIPAGRCRLRAAARPQTQLLEFTTGRGFRTPALQHTNLRVGEGYAGQAALERRMIYIPELAGNENGFQRSGRFSEEGFITYHAAPLISKGRVKGVMEVFHRTRFEVDQDWLDFLDALVAQAAIALDNASLFDNLEQTNIELVMAYDTTLEGWSRALELRDHETEGHSKRVTRMTLTLARALGIKECGPGPHPAGGHPARYRQDGHPGRYPAETRAAERIGMGPHAQASTLAYDMLSPIDYLRPAWTSPIVTMKNGMAVVPHAAKGEQIPLTARIFAIVDVWDALRLTALIAKPGRQKKPRLISRSRPATF